VALQKGEWPFFPELENEDPKQAATDRYNRESLVGLLRSSGEETVELYGVWDGILRRSLDPRKRCPWSDSSNRISVSENRVFIESD